MSQIQQSGLTPGLLAAYKIGWSVGTTLIYTALAALIFWRRSFDRMALFCAYMLVLFGGATYTGLLDLGLRTVSPAWFWLVGGLELLAQVCVPTFFLLFPSGRFVPRWSRWGVLIFVLYFVWYIFLTNAYLGQLSELISLVFAVLLLGLVGLQIYRYRRVSVYRERQQTKWVEKGREEGKLEAQRQTLQDVGQERLPACRNESNMLCNLRPRSVDTLNGKDKCCENI